jgi:hypothetical protein
MAAGEGGSGCPGIAITPDAMGHVAAGTNSLGINGSFFTYSDCKDLKSTMNGVGCSDILPDPSAGAFANVGGKICTSGMTSTVTGAWGAGVGFELNDVMGQQPYDTMMHGVKGFCFLLSGNTIPSTSLRVAFTTKDNNDNAYFEPVTTPGMHTVLFSDPTFAQGSWVTTKSAWEPTLVVLMQFQIPSATAAPVPFDFCIEGLTAVTQ